MAVLATAASEDVDISEIEPPYGTEPIVIDGPRNFSSDDYTDCRLTPFYPGKMINKQDY